MRAKTKKERRKKWFANKIERSKLVSEKKMRNLILRKIKIEKIDTTVPQWLKDDAQMVENAMAWRDIERSKQFYIVNIPLDTEDWYWHKIKNTPLMSYIEGARAIRVVHILDGYYVDYFFLKIKGKWFVSKVSERTKIPYKELSNTNRYDFVKYLQSASSYRRIVNSELELARALCCDYWNYPSRLSHLYRTEGVKFIINGDKLIVNLDFSCGLVLKNKKPFLPLTDLISEMLKDWSFICFSSPIRGRISAKKSKVIIFAVDDHTKNKPIKDLLEGKESGESGYEYVEIIPVHKYYTAREFADLMNVKNRIIRKVVNLFERCRRKANILEFCIAPVYKKL